MATFIVHLRIAERLAKLNSNYNYEKFILGNVAPDSGIVKEDGTVHPAIKISHFKENNTYKNLVHPEWFYEKYLENKKYSIEKESFYLGYYAHLLTDMYFKKDVIDLEIKAFKDKFDNLSEMKEQLEKDWYDLDFLFLKKNKNYLPWITYKEMKDIRNTYLDEFCENDFCSKRKEIIDFYSEERKDLDRRFIYLNEEEIDNFIGAATARINYLLENINR